MNLRSSASSFTRYITEQISVPLLHWTRVTDFDTVDPISLVQVLSRVLSESGVYIFALDAKSKHSWLRIRTASSTSTGKDKVCFLPYVSRGLCSDPPFSHRTIHIDTPFSRLLGGPPIAVINMTPSTVRARGRHSLRRFPYRGWGTSR